jgi:hypothetical protein
MEAVYVSPFSLTYNGNDAEQHVINARQYGVSITGASKLYTATAHYCVYGLVPPRGNYKKEFECYAFPAREKCFEYQLLIAALAAEYTLHAEIYKEGLGFVFSRVIDAIKRIWLKPGDMEKIVTELAAVMKHQASENTSVQTVLANGLIKSNDNMAGILEKLIATLPQLADRTRSHGTLLVTPIGDSCTSLTQFAHTQQASVISEPEAEVIRGGSDMEIDDMQKFLCKRITEVNTVNGHCFLEVEGFDYKLTGKISDPALALPNNIYTQALNDHSSFIISAKPVKKNGEIQKLFVSDAEKKA